MRWRGAFALAVLVAGCAQPEGYPVPGQAALDRLAESGLADFVEMRRCGIDVDVTTETIPDKGQVVWNLRSDNRTLLRLIATVVPVTAGRSKIDLATWDREHGAGAYDGTRFYARPIVNQPVLPALREHVDALMADRDYDIARAIPPEPGRMGRSDRQTDHVCDVQRAGRQSGLKFAADDEPGMDSSASAARRAGDAAERAIEGQRVPYGEPDAIYGKPVPDQRQ